MFHLFVSNKDIHCFHCGQTIPEGLDLHIEINHQAQPMCCKGREIRAVRWPGRPCASNFDGWWNLSREAWAGKRTGEM